MLLSRLALRNLGRHRRRSVMLGASIALGTAVLVTANAFAHGISVTMFERVIVWVAGHAGVVASEVGNPDRQLFRDGPFLRSVMEGLPQVKRVDEAVAVFVRALGKGRSDNAVLIGVDLKSEMDEKDRRAMEESFRMLQGSWTDLDRQGEDIPLILAKEKARELGVDSGEEIRFRFSDAHGAYQASKGKVVGIFQTDNMFMQAPIFVEISRLRGLMGYESWESSGLTLVLHDPVREAGDVADSLHARLKPRIATMQATTSGGRTLSVYGLRGDSAARVEWATRYGVPDSLLTRKDLALVGSGMGALNPDTIAIAWPARYGNDSGRAVLRRILPVAGLPDSVILWREEAFFRSWNGVNPPRPPEVSGFDSTMVSFEWNLPPRPRTTDEYRKMLANAALTSAKGPTVIVYTMFEAASDILKLEAVLNLITLWAVLVLFFIILIGVLNTLRMTIRERTREIGTLRAIGFQARQVQGLFLLETLYLSVVSCGVGVGLGYAIMKGLSSIPIHLENNPLGMVLVDGRLFFSPTTSGILTAVVLITMMAVATAFLPSRTAARLSPADALRHHE
ncbi:MAG: FtsX-like permease family protein [Fibrobacteria bacterium]|nr:FtsX-like permease family protein [Fibrobacteria bacterium]